MSISDFGEIASFTLGADSGVPAEAQTALDLDGVVCLRGAFKQSWLDIIEAGIESALNGASTNIDIVKRDSDAGAFSVSSGAWSKVDAFRHFIFDSPVADIAWALMDTRQLVLFYDFLLVKEAHSNSAATPWHQDHSYYPLDGAKLINCWIALDNIPLQSALRFVRGSHRSAVLYRAIDFDQPEKDYRHARKELPLPPTDSREVSADILSVAVNAGDMLVWTSYTLHSAPGNRLDRRRAAFSVNWLGDDIVYNGKPSLETYRDPGLVAGQAMICEKFPLMRG